MKSNECLNCGAWVISEDAFCCTECQQAYASRSDNKGVRALLWLGFSVFVSTFGYLIWRIASL